jgi:prolipoprotein diacylglyceryl transferase
VTAFRPPATIPSPSQGVWHLGPLPLRAYAFCIIVGIVVAVALTDRRWEARGGSAGTVSDVATWAVPFGLIGGRIYHVLTDWSAYFGRGAQPLRSLEIWKGGLGVPGAVALGALGAYIACRRRGIPLPPMADAIAPGLVLAQGVGRWGNYFNQELYGRATQLPWGLRIDAAHSPNGVAGIFQPTFLYESIWDVGTAAILLWADRRFTLGHGRVFGLYMIVYGAGRSWIEALRIDPAHHILGLRLNDWMSILVFTAGLIGFVVSARRHPGREIVVEPEAGREHRQPEAVLEPGSGRETAS